LLQPGAGGACQQLALRDMSFDTCAVACCGVLCCVPSLPPRLTRMVCPRC
jgi:hypothetical protein